MSIGNLIIFSGLPGSGKSTLASRLASQFGATYLRADTMEQGLREICQISEINGKGYRLLYRLARENLQLGNDVIADSVNPWPLTRREWNDVAREVGANFINVEIFCSDKGEHRRRIEGREISVAGLIPPTWKEVLARDYHEWSDERVSLDTSGKTIDESLKELISSLQSKGFFIEMKSLA